MSEAFGDITFKEKPDIAQVFIRQLDRTNQAAMLNPNPHQSAIYQILSNLPYQWREWVYGQDDRYTEIRPTLMYKKFAGNRQGSKSAPSLKNPKNPVRRLENGEIDWTDPNIRSPILKDHIEINYHAFNELVMEAAEQAGLTWQTEYTNKVVAHISQIKRKKTPYRKPRKNNDSEESEAPEETEDPEGEG